MADDLKALHSRALDETINQGNLDVVDELVSPGYVMRDPNAPADLRGPEQLKAYIKSIREAFPDIRIRVDEQVGEGNRVVTVWTATGTHRGTFNGIPATGKGATVRGVTITRWEGGKVVDEFQLGDNLGLLQQLGVIPTMAPAGSTA